jgi:hypothetical protein
MLQPTARHAASLFAVALVASTLSIRVPRASAQEPASTGGGLTAGLTAKPREPEAPAQIKARDGTPKLRWWSTTQMGSRTTQTSTMERGWLLLKSGEKLQGEIAIKRVTDRDGTHLQEVEYRPAKGQDKQKYAGSAVHDFGFAFTLADYSDNGKRKYDEPANEFLPGTIFLNDSTQKKGLVALNTYAELYFAADSGADIESIASTRVKSAQQWKGNSFRPMVNYRGYVMPTLTWGRNFWLFRNPLPTTRKDGFRVGLAQTLGAVATQVATEAAYQTAAEKEAKERAKNGENLGNVVYGAASAGEKAAGEMQQMLATVDLTGYKEEFVIQNMKAMRYTIITEDNAAKELGPAMDQCDAFKNMDRRTKDRYLEMKFLPQLVRMLDECFTR